MHVCIQIDLSKNTRILIDANFLKNQLPLKFVYTKPDTLTHFLGKKTTIFCGSGMFAHVFWRFPHLKQHIACALKKTIVKNVP